MKVVRVTVDYHSPSNNLIHRKPIRFHGQICVSMACQQRRQIACVFRMYLTRWIRMASCSGKINPGATFVPVNMEAEESCITFRQTGNLRYDQHASAPLIKPNAAR